MKNVRKLVATVVVLAGASNIQGFAKSGPPAKAAAPAPAPARPAPASTRPAPAPSRQAAPQRNNAPVYRQPQQTNPYNRPGPYQRPTLPQQQDQRYRNSVYQRPTYRPSVDHRMMERTVPLRNGHVTFGADRSPHVVALRGMTITHGQAGMRTVEIVRPDRSTIIVDRAGQGAIERPFFYGGANFVRRTNYVNHEIFTSYYRPVPYPGHALMVYTPAAYYSSGFYGWAARPWGPRVAFNWGWAGSPWYGYYGGAFMPYTYYDSAAPWLTDYMVSSSMAGAYQQQVDAAQMNGQPFSGNSYGYPGTPMSQQVKDNFDRQTEAYLQQYSTTPPNTPPQVPTVAQIVASGQPHEFMAGGDLDVFDSNGNQCALTQGDTMRFNPPATGANPVTVDVQVTSSKAKDCKAGSTVTVAMNQLQEMENYAQQTMDRGLAQLNAQNGGIPQPPGGASTSPAPFIQGAPAPDPNVPGTLQGQLRDSQQAENDAMKGTGGQGFAP